MLIRLDVWQIKSGGPAVAQPRLKCQQLVISHQQSPEMVHQPSRYTLTRLFSRAQLAASWAASLQALTLVQIMINRLKATFPNRWVKWGCTNAAERCRFGSRAGRNPGWPSAFIPSYTEIVPLSPTSSSLGRAGRGWCFQRSYKPFLLSGFSSLRLRAQCRNFRLGLRLYVLPNQAVSQAKPF